MSLANRICCAKCHVMTVKGNTLTTNSNAPNVD